MSVTQNCNNFIIEMSPGGFFMAKTALLTQQDQYLEFIADCGTSSDGHWEKQLERLHEAFREMAIADLIIQARK